MPQQPKLKLKNVREVKDDKNRSKKQPKKKEKVPDDSPKQELRVPVTLADHLKSKRATKPLLR
jgi:hypothetical protein